MLRAPVPVHLPIATDIFCSNFSFPRYPSFILQVANYIYDVIIIFFLRHASLPAVISRSFHYQEYIFFYLEIIDCILINSQVMRLCVLIPQLSATYVLWSIPIEDNYINSWDHPIVFSHFQFYAIVSLILSVGCQLKFVVVLQTTFCQVSIKYIFRFLQSLHIVNVFS